MAEVCKKVVRWRLWLSIFKPDILQRAGIMHHATDSFSKRPASGKEKSKLEDVFPELNNNPGYFKVMHRVGIEQEKEPEEYSTRYGNFFRSLRRFSVLPTKPETIETQHNGPARVYYSSNSRQRINPRSSNSRTAKNVVLIQRRRFISNCGANR